MGRANWLGLVVCVAVAVPAAAQPVRRVGVPDFPETTSSAPLSRVHDDGPMRDLTPTNFADLIPAPATQPVGHGAGCEASCAEPAHPGWYATGEYLLLRPRADAYDFAIRGLTPGLATVGPIESLKSALASGFRAEAGFRFASGWEAGFAYTLVNSGGSRTLAAPTGSVLYPTITRPGLTDTVLFAAASNDLNYNLYDLLVGKRWKLDDHFGLRAFGGVRFADIGRRMTAVFDGLDANLAAVRTRSGFDGFGPLIGAEATLYGWGGFHLYTRATGGLITGRSTNRLLETNNADATVYANTGYDVRKVVPVASLAIGGGWQYRTVSIRTGYEITHWSGFGEPVRFVDDIGQGKIVTRPSALSLEGFFFQVGVAF
jgi:hypothetical protein